MTDPVPPPPLIPDDFVARYRRHQEQSALQHQGNKERLFAVLAAAGITQVIVDFDGGGDSGQIEDVPPMIGMEGAELPDGEVEIRTLDFDCETIRSHSRLVADAIEGLCYGFLETAHGGWENNDGAFGEIVLDVAEGTITLDFNYRVMETEHHSHFF